MIIRAWIMAYFAIYFFYFVGQTEFVKIFKQEAMHVTTLGQLGIAKFCPKLEIVDVTTKSKEAIRFWITCSITWYRIDIALWKRIVHHFEIEIISFMKDTSYEFIINNTTDKKIQKVSCLWLLVLAFSNNVLSFISFEMSPKYIEFTVQISSKYLQLCDSNFAIA